MTIISIAIVNIMIYIGHRVSPTNSVPLGFLTDISANQALMLLSLTVLLVGSVDDAVDKKLNATYRPVTVVCIYPLRLVEVIPTAFASFTILTFVQLPPKVKPDVAELHTFIQLDGRHA